ncbi:MAG: radical SAM protein [Oscillospiraceae bacterium]|nr:radical SAM protein [Oscillospiraceae bacterium]
MKTASKITNVKSMIFRQGVKFLREDFRTNAMMLLEGITADSQSDEHKAKIIAILKKGLEAGDNMWVGLLERIVMNTSPEAMEKLIEPLKNVIFNSYHIRAEMIKKHDCNVPWIVLIDPTSACNLKCKGCWSAEYHKDTQLSYKDITRIINQGKELGVYAYFYTGGEPLLRKRDIIRICEEHPDCLFLAFTNGTLCDESFADELARVGNLLITFSIEGDKETTDGRRGIGVYDLVLEAMARLRERELPFGASICCTSANVDVVSSDEYADFLIAQGVLLTWFFTYIPVGAGAPTELMVSAEQRERMYDQVRKWRREKPFLPIDFFNDGEYVNGCVAGGKQYFHINSNGDCEPCVFAHYSNVNIKNATFLDALQSPLFKAFRDRQPFTPNHLRPCPVLDNPGGLRRAVQVSGATSTNRAQPESAADLFAKTAPTARKWKETADRLAQTHGLIDNTLRSAVMYRDFEARRVADFEEF